MSEWEDAPTVAATTSDGWEDAPSTPASTPPERQPATTGDRAAAAVGGVNKGIAGLLGLPVDTIENIINIALSTRGMLTDDPNIDLVKGSFGSSQHVAEVMEKAGIETENPRPDDPASRMLHTGGMIAGGSAVIPGAGARSTMAAATGGSAASEALGPEWTGVGAMTPASASAMARNARTSMAATAAPNVKAFEDAGTRASLSQATESSFMSGLENLALKFPGGSGVMREFVKKQQAQMGTHARTGTPAEQAGRAIEKGVTGKDGFIARSKAEWIKLDDAVAAKIQPNARFAPSNTVTALDDLTKPVAGAEKTTAALTNPKLAEMKQNLSDDLAANNGAIPFEALRALRTKVGSMLDDSLVSGVPNGELKKLYGALSRDLKASAEQAGAGQEFARQSNFYRARMDRIENVLERVIGKGKQPEEIFKSVNPTDPDQANKLRAVMRSLEPAERKVVSEAVVNRLGRATPGRQDEVGEVFSSETFLTNWAKLSPGAKAQLFPDEAMRSNITSLADAAAKIRAGSQSMSNPSGTAGSFAAYSIYLSPIAAAATGNIDLVTAAAMSTGTAYIGARMLTSPKVVAWLAKGPKIAPDRTAAHLTRLGVIYNEADDDLKSDLDRYMESVKDAPVRTTKTKDEIERAKRRDELLGTLN